MNKRFYFYGVPIDCLSMNETINLIDRSIQSGRKIQQVSLNIIKFMMLREFNEQYQGIKKADIVNIDGQGLLFALKLLKMPFKDRIAGIDLMQRLIELAEKRKYKVFLLGARKDVVKKVAELINNKYSDVVVGYHHGYFEPTEEEAIVDKINSYKVNILFIGISSPKKEIFIKRNKEKLNVSFIMGVGGSFDVLAGRIKRAPTWMQKIGMEWFYRFIQEPYRFSRYFKYYLKFLVSFWDTWLRRKEIVSYLN